MRLKLTAAVFAAACVAAFACAWPACADTKALYEDAKKEGGVTWYITHYPTELAVEVGQSFTQRYPGVTVNVVRTTAEVAYQRLNQDLKAGAANCDVFSSTDVGHYIALKEKSLLAHYVPGNASKLIPEFRKYADEGYYYPTSAGLVMLIYNTKLVPAAEAPKNWPDLLDPKWRGKIALGNPGFSAYVGTWVVEMQKLYGWDYFEKLAKNAPLNGRSINDTVTMLNSGERQIGVGPDQTTLNSAARGNPVGIIYPTDGAVLMVAPSGIMANAPHPNAARLFMEFLLSAQYSRILVKSYAVPLRPEVAPAPGEKPFSEIKLVRPTDEEIFKGIPEVIEKWRDTMGN